MLRNFKQFNNLIKIMTFTSYKPHFNISFLNKSANTTFSLNYHPKYRFASQTIPLPHLADSITEGKVIQIKKKVGDWVQLDELVSLIQTDKITIEIKAPKAGLLTKLHVQSGDILVVGKPFFDIDPAGAKPVDTKSPEPEKKTQTPKTSTAQSKSTQSLKSETPKKQQPKKEVKKQSQPKVQTPNIFSNVTGSTFERKQTREPLSRLRLKVGQRLKQSQNTYALLTTFQEADMSGVMDIRKSLGQQFAQKYGIKLGFMSFFLKAAVAAINDIPIVNAVIDGTDVVHRNYIDISVAVATPTGLMVPIIRNCQNLKMHEIQIQLAQLAKKGKQGKITLQDINGGTFTISNGGTFGSLMGTPIINPPQSAILGMHAIINRPVVKNDQIVARPMMYLALTYDHRLLDGKDAVTFLKKIQNEIQDPRRLLLEI